MRKTMTINVAEDVNVDDVVGAKLSEKERKFVEWIREKLRELGLELDVFHTETKFEMRVRFKK
jgi:hypothetical protein